MRSTERPVRLWSHLLGVVVALELSMSAHAATPADSPALNRPTCLANGNWYGFYHGNQGLKAVCLKLPEAISVKMLDSNADGVVDNLDTLSDGVIFVGEHSTQDPRRQWRGRERFHWRRYPGDGKIRRQPSHHVATNTVSES